MFWDAVQAAFVALTHWQVYAAGLEYVIILFVPIVIAAIVRFTYGPGDAVKHTTVILVPIFQAIGTLFFVYSVALIALGQADYSTWRIPFEIAFYSPGQFLLLPVVIVLASLVLALLPIINQIYALQTLVLSALALAMLFVVADGRGFPRFSEINWLPGFWFIVGIIVVETIVGAIGLGLAAIFPQLLSKLAGRDMTTLGTLICVPIISTLGFVSFLIYAAWIGAQIPAAG